MTCTPKKPLYPVNPMVKLHCKIGKTPVVIEADNVKEAFAETELLCQLPSVCACGSDNIIPAYSKAASSGDEFYFLKCRDCQKEFKLGQRRSDEALYPKFDDGDNGWVEPYKHQQKREEEPKGRTYSSPRDAGRGGSRGSYGKSENRFDDRQSGLENRPDREDRRSTRHEDADF